MLAKSIAIRQDKRSSTRYTTVNTKARLSSDSRVKTIRQPLKKKKKTHLAEQRYNAQTNEQCYNAQSRKRQT